MDDEMKRRQSRVAAGCPAFEHVIAAMGYGCSLANVSPETFMRRCSDCVNWQGGSCPIWQEYRC